MAQWWKPPKQSRSKEGSFLVAALVAALVENPDQGELDDGPWVGLLPRGSRYRPSQTIHLELTGEDLIALCEIIIAHRAGKREEASGE